MKWCILLRAFLRPSPNLAFFFFCVQSRYLNWICSLYQTKHACSFVSFGKHRFFLKPCSLSSMVISYVWPRAISFKDGPLTCASSVSVGSPLWAQLTSVQMQISMWAVPTQEQDLRSLWFKHKGFILAPKLLCFFVCKCSASHPSSISTRSVTECMQQFKCPTDLDQKSRRQHSCIPMSLCCCSEVWINTFSMYSEFCRPFKLPSRSRDHWYTDRHNGSAVTCRKVEKWSIKFQHFTSSFRTHLSSRHSYFNCFHTQQ